MCKESVDNLHSLELFHVDNTKLKEEMTLLNEEKEFRRYLDFLQTEMWIITITSLINWIKVMGQHLGEMGVTMKMLCR